MTIFWCTTSSRLRVSLLVNRRSTDHEILLAFVLRLFTGIFWPDFRQNRMPLKKKERPIEERSCEKVATLSCHARVLHIIIEKELVGMGTKTKRIMFLALVFDPHFQKVAREALPFKT